MQETDLNTSKIQLYEPGDTLRLCQPGDILSLFEKHGSLLLFRVKALPMPDGARSVWGRIQEHAKRNTMIYIGDLVTESLEEISRGHDLNYKMNGLGEKSQRALSQSLKSIGLCFDLKVPEWGPAYLHGLEQYLPQRGEKGLEQYLEKIIRPEGPV